MPFRKIICAVAAIVLTNSLLADEGMWMINAVDKALEKKMQERGLLLGASEIYNADAPGTSLADAVVSLDFGCTGSIVSSRGLVITNHHCAYGDVHAISTPEHNYLEDGFWAFTDAEEVPVKGKKIQFLKRVIDVTDEAKRVWDEQQLEGRPMGFRRLSRILEKKFSDETGLTASLSSMWGGSKYYMALYEEYCDIRLVAAPPVSIAAFGGDEDNWEWPQHKCDFAMYRIYTAPDGSPAEYSPENVPLKPARKLNISKAGFADGDFTMVIGYPGRTARYSSSAKTEFEKDVTLPISNRVRASQMEIISRWMDADPAVRLKYSNRFFSLSNVQELQEGEVLCYNRFDVVRARMEEEKTLASKDAAFGDLLRRLSSTYKAIAPAERNLSYYRETIVRGIRPRLVAIRISNLGGSRDASRNTPERILKEKKNIAGIVSEMDFRVEKELWLYNARVFFENVDSAFWGPAQKEAYLRSGGDFEAIWNGSWLSDEAFLAEFLSTPDLPTEAMKADPLYNILTENRMAAFNDAVLSASGGIRPADLGREYTRALYAMRNDLGIIQYPDANSTMRLTYGRVGGYEPRDGVICLSKSTPGGLLAKHDPSRYDFCLKDEWRDLLRNEKPSMPVDFLTDNDITGGNSGSPVLNARGELIGLAFDGNKESLASDAAFVEGYNKCVCVDIRFVLWTLERYARLDRILSEIEAAD